MIGNAPAAMIFPMFVIKVGIEQYLFTLRDSMPCECG